MEGIEVVDEEEEEGGCLVGDINSYFLKLARNNL
jgi:hypothetical protein